MASRLAVRLIVLLLVAAVIGAWWYRADQQRVPQAEDACLSNLQPVAAVEIALLVQPDDGIASVLDEIAASQCEILLNIYLLSDERMMDALADAHDRGVQVRAIVEQDPFGGWGIPTETIAWLNQHGIEWKAAPDRFQFSHAKYLLVDRQVALILNQNFTWSGFETNREFGVLTTDVAVTSELHGVFEADWDNREISIDSDVLITSPDSSRHEVMRLIESAEHSIDIFVEIVRDTELIDALGDAVDRGVRVRMLTTTSSEPEAQAAYEALLNVGVELRFGTDPYVHAKAMVIDGERVFVGSQNFTFTSLNLNREVGIITEDPLVASRLTSVFEADWRAAAPAA